MITHGQPDSYVLTKDMNNNPESLKTIALSAKALKNIEKLAWPKGAVLSCPICFRTSTKTPEQMSKYALKWPKCCGLPAEVRPL